MIEIIEAFDEAIIVVWGLHLARPWPNPKDRLFAERWLTMGADKELCFKIFKADMERKECAKKPIPSCLAYYDNSIRQAIATKPTQADELSPEESRWKARVEGFKRSGMWLENMWGPKPTEAGNSVPKSIMRMVGV